MNVPDVQMIPIERIVEGTRMRPVDEAVVAMLADRIEAEGVRSPIEVHVPDKDGSHLLIAGAHRLRAARLVGLAAIPVIVLDLDPVDAGLRQVDENLMRRELSELERGKFMSSRAELHAKKYGPRGRGGDRRSVSVANLGKWSRFNADLAEMTRLSQRSIRRTMERYEKIGAVLSEKLLGTPYADNGSELDAIKQLPDDDRAPILEILLAEKCSVKKARAKYAKQPVVILSRQQKQMNTLRNAWENAEAEVLTEFMKSKGIVFKKGRAHE